MKSQTLSCGVMNYDRVVSLQNGKIEIAGYGLEFPEMGPGEVAQESLGTGQLALAEVSPQNLVLALESGNDRYVGLPIFLSRAFRHGLIFVRADSGIDSPGDLAGGRIGTLDFFGTTTIWQRGMLQDDHKIDAKKVTWVVGPVDDPNDYTVPASERAYQAFSVEAVSEGDSLTAMMERGELDAILTLRPPKAFAGGKVMKRLFADYVAAEQDYFRRTKLFPIMHIAVLRRDYVEADAELPDKLFEAFEKAKAAAQEALRSTLFYHATLPWLPAAVEQAEDVLGTDFWPYGLNQRDADTMTVFLRYCHEQNLTSRKLALSDLFPHHAS